MSIDTWIVLAIIVFSLVAFSLELLRSDMVAILVMCLLIFTGVLTAEEATRGFSSPATLTVGCMFIISAVFVKAGLVEFTAQLLEGWENPNATLSIFALMCIVGILSAFINNTAAVAVFIPIAVKLAKVSGSTRKQFLMPLSFAAIFGGTCTLLGTSTNILVNSIYVERGFAGFSMFEFAGIGALLSLAGMTYMMTVGRFFLGSKVTGDISDEAHTYLTAVKLLKESPSVGKKLQDSPFFEDFQQNIISMEREDRAIPITENTYLQEGDRFLLVCSKEKILALRTRVGISILEGDLRDEEIPKDIQIFELEQNLDVAESVLQSAQALLNKLVSEESQLHTKVPEEKARLVRLNDSLKSSEARLVQVNQRIAQLDKDLAGYDGTKKQIEDKMAAINAQTQAVQARYMRYFL